MCTSPSPAASPLASARKWLHNLHNAVIFFLFFPPPRSSPYPALYIGLFFSPVIILSLTPLHRSSQPATRDTIPRFKSRACFPFISSRPLFKNCWLPLLGVGSRRDNVEGCCAVRSVSAASILQSKFPFDIPPRALSRGRLD